MSTADVAWPERRGVRAAIIARASSPRERSEGSRTALPPWVEAFDELMDDSGPAGDDIEQFAVGDLIDAEALAASGIALDSPWPFHPAFQGLLGVGAATIERIAAVVDLPLSSSAARGMLVQLARRWNAAAVQTLAHEIDLADLLTGHPGRIGTRVVTWFFQSPRGSTNEWMNLFAVYPVLARLLAVAFINWRDALGELLGRLTRDRVLLSRTFFGPSVLGRLEEYTGDAGDLHNGGRAVVVLTFAGPTRLVYKPKDLRGAAAFMDLVTTLNASGLDHPLHVRHVIARGEYGWEEHVHPSACRTRQDVADYYWRLGAHERLLQLLDGSDFTANNVIAAADHPVLVDLETLLAPRPRVSADLSPFEGEMRQPARDMPSQTGLISARIPGEPGRRAADIGAAARLTTRVAPFRGTAVGPHVAGRAESRQAWSFFGKGTAIPTHEGRPVTASEHVDAIVHGYVAMARHVRGCAGDLNRIGHPIRRMLACPVRFIHRNTHIYSRLLDESLRPSCLRDGVERETCLERLWRAGLRRPIPAPIIQAEIDALRDLDIPFFAAMPGRNTLAIRGHPEVEGFFDDDVWGRLTDRMKAGAGRSDDEEADVICTTLFTLDPEACRPDAPAAISAPGTGPSCDAVNWLREATGIADALLESAYRCEEEVAWLGVDYHPWSDSWRFGVLHPDLFSGAAGIAVLFADLYRLTGLLRFQRIASGILRSLSRNFSTTVAEACERAEASAGRPTRPIPCGGYYGLGAWLHALNCYARACDDDRMLSQAIRELDACPATSFDESGDDLISGKAGLLLAILATDRHRGDRRLRDLAVRLGCQLAIVVELSEADLPACYPPDARPLQKVPPRRAGIRLALLALSAALDREADLSGAHAGSRRAWKSGDGATGTTGETLAQLAAARYEPALQDDALRLAEMSLIEPGSVAASRDLLESAEVAITAFQVGGRPEHYDVAESCARILVGKRRSSGSWFPGCLAGDRFNLSAVLGVTAVAHLFLRVNRPDAIGSVRLLA